MQEHEHDVPVVVSDDNIANVNIVADEYELEPYKKSYIKQKHKKND